MYVFAIFFFHRMILLFVNDVLAEYQPFVFALYNKKDAPYNALTIEHV